MKKEKTILILFLVPLFLLTSSLNIERKKCNLTSHEVEFTFTGNVALYGTPKDCGLFSPDTVTLKGLLSGDESVHPGPYDPVVYAGVLHINIKMAICNVKRVNGEDQFCTMTVNGNGPVKTELEIDTAAGYGYIKIDYDSTKLGAFTRHVYGTCDPQEMKEEEDNVPNNTIAAIFNGLELRSLKNTPKLRIGTYTESGPGGKTVVKVIR